MQTVPVPLNPLYAVLGLFRVPLAAVDDFTTLPVLVSYFSVPHSVHKLVSMTVSYIAVSNRAHISCYPLSPTRILTVYTSSSILSMLIFYSSTIAAPERPSHLPILNDQLFFYWFTSLLIVESYLRMAICSAWDFSLVWYVFFSYIVTPLLAASTVGIVVARATVRASLRL